MQTELVQQQSHILPPCLQFSHGASTCQALCRVAIPRGSTATGRFPRIWPPIARGAKARAGSCETSWPPPLHRSPHSSVNAEMLSKGARTHALHQPRAAAVATSCPAVHARSNTHPMHSDMPVTCGIVADVILTSLVIPLVQHMRACIRSHTTVEA